MAQRKEKENKRYVWEGQKGRLINCLLDYKQHSWLLLSAKQMMKCQNFRLVCSWLFPFVLRYVFHTIQWTEMRLLHIRCLQLVSKKSGKGWSQVQHKHRECKMLWASISHQTAMQPFPERRKVPLWHCEPLCPNLITAPRWCSCVWGQL